MLKFKILGSVYWQGCLVVVNDQLSTGVYIGVVTFISKVISIYMYVQVIEITLC